MDKKIAEKARHVLSSAEESIRGLITNAAELQDYQAVANLAELAQTLASLAETNRFLRANRASEADSPVSRRVGEPAPKRDAPGKGRSKRKSAAKPSGAAKDFPKYHTERDRLVKIGWSKKQKDTYEHRAPREAVEAVVNQLNVAASSGRTVSVEELGTVELPNGNEVPSYQVYMTIAWLLVVNQLAKVGRDGYRIDEGVGSIDLSKVWSSTPKGEV